MNAITKLVKAYSKRAREKRASVFRNSFLIDENTKILDLGSETGSNIHTVLQGTPFKPQNIYIADIDSSLIEKGANTYGFVPVLISESEQLPFDDGFFDIVYCSSVIEHVTVPKEQVWSLYSGKEFQVKSFKRQKVFASEIRRLGKQYFVQTPYKHFPVESHSWLPFIAWLPRRLLIPILKITNTFWVKKTSPDWYLLNRNEMNGLFQDANIVSEKSLSLTKSIMAIKSHN
ncbi:MAG: class I SAM-dependent methyltransferase [Gammaproteobacteria bacterium]|nr:class I SAM-dependent methyltransferase [Gammaproteobacteria bacterium]